MICHFPGDTVMSYSGSHKSKRHDAPYTCVNMLRESTILHLLFASCLYPVILNAFIPAPLDHTHRPCCPTSRRARSTNEQAKSTDGRFTTWRHPPTRSFYPAPSGRRSSQTEGPTDDTIPWTDRAAFLRLLTSGLGLGSMLSVSLGGPKRATAFCGEPYPYWAYYVDFDEVSVPFEFQGYSGQVFARTVGNVKEQKKASVFDFPPPLDPRASHEVVTFSIAFFLRR